MNKQAATPLPSKIRGRIVLLAAALLGLYVILPRLGGDFSQSWHALTDADLAYVLAAALMTALTYGWAACTYWLLAIKPLRWLPTAGIQAASAFTNRLLPAGLGGLALNIAYLRKSKHSLPEALAVTGANNTLGLAGHILLFAAVAVTSGGAAFDGLRTNHVSSNIAWIVAGLLVLAAVNVLVFKRLRKYLYKLTADIMRNFATYRRRPVRLLSALLCSMALTSSYALVFYLSGLAIGIDLSLWSMFAVFTVGILAASVTPTPGGLGGAEAGLLAGLASYGTDLSAGLAVVLLYRLLTYWLPLLPGFAAFWLVRRRYLD